MTRLLWSRFLRHLGIGRRSRRASPSKRSVSSRRRVRPCLEFLEDRTVPAAFYVDPGNVAELVADIKTANSNGQSNVINLFNNSTYDLTKIDNYWYGPNGLPPITSNLTIHGNGATIQRDPASGTSDFRLFYVSGGMELKPGTLTMDNVTLKNGLAKGGDSFDGGGGLGAGGAIFNQGTLNLTDVTLADNEAQGGSSGVKGAGDGGGGMGQDAPSIGSGGGFGGSVGNYGGTGGAGAAVTQLGGGGGGGGGGFLAGANGSTYPGHGGGLGGFSTFGADGGSGGIGANEGNEVAGGDGGNFGSGGGITAGGGTESGGLTNSGGGGGVGGGGSASYFGSGDGGFGGGGGGDGPLSYQGGNGGFGGGGGGGGEVNNGIPAGGAGSGGFGGGNGSFGGEGGGGAGMGGAIFNMGADSAHPGSGTATLINCTLTNNSAQGGSPPAVNGGALGQGLGGGVFNLDGSVSLTNDTVSGNHASFAGNAVYNLAYGNDIDTGAPVTASLVLNNNILANTGGSSVSDLVSTVQSANLAATATVSGSHNLVMRSAGTINPGVITQTADPKLGPLQNNGGLTPTMKPQPGSPALGGGDHSVAPSTDQRGVPRYFGLLPVPIDLGSVQVSDVIALPPNPPAALPPSSPPSSPPAPPPPSLLQAILGLYLAEVEKDLHFGNPAALQDAINFNAQYTVIFGINIAPLIEQLADANVQAALSGSSS